jgi:hypothetical protein
MKNVYLLRHQSAYMQAPYLYPETRWFFLVCGYGAGKTRANVFALLYAVKKLQGKKDYSGDYARLMVAGYTLAHLNKTFLVYLRQMLDQSRTPYTENKKDNFFTIGTVTVFIIPMENPENIFGIDVHAIYGEELDELTEDKAIEAVRALSERCRQQMPGERGPFLCFGSTSQGQKGLYRIYAHFKKTGSGFVLIRGRTEDNPYLPASLIQDMKKMYSAAEKSVFMDGEFLAVAKGRVLGDFDWERNYLDYDLDTALLPGEAVYIGMDFNCVAQGEKVYTLRGNIPIERVIAGKDYVLTRQGYKKVTRVFNNGKNAVSRCATVFSTRGHIFRTPEGDRAQWQVKEGGRTYFLPEQESWRLQLFGAAVKLLEIANTLNSTECYTIGMLTERGLRLASTFLAPRTESCCMSPFGNFITGLCRRGFRYTIRMALMIIGLKLLSCFLLRSIRRCTRNGVGRRSARDACLSWKKQGEKLRNGTPARQEERITGVFRSRRGPMASLLVKFSAAVVEKLLTLLLEQQCIAPSARKRAGKNPGGKRIDTEGLAAGTEQGRCNVSFVADRLQELLQRDIARSIRIGGNDGSGKEYEANVYDLEVEDAHEYFVNGTLVHNTGFNRASAYIAREGVIYCVKYYDFPNAQDAPSVFRHDFPQQRVLWLPDVTIKDSFPQFARELRKHGVQIIYRKKSPLVEDTVFLANKLFYTGRLLICKIAKDLAEACALATRDKDNKIPKGVGPGSAMHAVDGLRYAIAFICSRDKAFLDIRRLVLDKRASFRPDSDALVRDLGSGYTQIDPRALYSGKKL